MRGGDFFFPPNDRLSSAKLGTAPLFFWGGGSQGSQGVGQAELGLARTIAEGGAFFLISSLGPIQSDEFIEVPGTE